MIVIVEHGKIKILRDKNSVGDILWILTFGDKLKRQLYVRSVRRENYNEKESFAMKKLIKESVRYSTDKYKNK